MAGARARGATLYCSLEPCSYTGRTGPCAERVAEAGIARVVAAVEDPNPLVQGRGFAYLRSRGVQVDIGEGRDVALALNRPFFTLMQEARPFVTLKAAVSVDGCMTGRAGERTLLTSEVANRHAHRIRAAIDAIGVGVGTVLVDDPSLTPRGAFREQPLTRVVFDRRLRTPPTARLFSTLDAGPVVIVTTEAGDTGGKREALEKAGAELVVTDGSLRAAVRMLGRRGLASLLIEGGAALHRAAWDEGVVDYVRVYVTPHVLGPEGLPFLGGRGWSALPWSEPHIEPLGPDILMEGCVHVHRAH
jgi:diaminohydroxyphosphoribosylaminopyrimidine deaminase/5-amino-6-(5-phosphoribosylamino)uracil reductase